MNVNDDRARFLNIFMDVSQVVGVRGFARAWSSIFVMSPLRCFISSRSVALVLLFFSCEVWNFFCLFCYFCDSFVFCIVGKVFLWIFMKFLCNILFFKLFFWNTHLILYLHFFWSLITLDNCILKLYSNITSNFYTTKFFCNLSIFIGKVLVVFVLLHMVIKSYLILFLSDFYEGRGSPQKETQKKGEGTTMMLTSKKTFESTYEPPNATPHALLL